MIIITASNKKYEPILVASLYNNNQLGYNPLIYNLNSTLNYGIPITVDEEYDPRKKKLGMSPYKPQIIIDTIKNNPDEKTFIWMDADAFAIDHLDDIEHDDNFDLGVVIRPAYEIDNKIKMAERFKRYLSNWNSPYKPPEAFLSYIHAAEWSGYINAGIIFIKPTKNREKVIEFLKLWEKTVPDLPFNSDQHALTNIILPYNNLLEPNQIFDIFGIKVKTFTTHEYNFFHFDQPLAENTKIVHLKSHFKNKKNHDKWWQENKNDPRIARAILPI